MNYISETHWPEKEYLYLNQGDLTLAYTPYPEIEEGATLLCWRSNDLEQLAEVIKEKLPGLPRPLYMMLPGPEPQVLATIPLFQALGFCLDSINLEMILAEIPAVESPAGVKDQSHDFAALAELDLRHFPQHSQDQETLRNRASAPDWRVIYVEVEGVLAGMAVGQVYGPNNSHLFIRSLAVDSRFRGLGLGRQLMQGLFAWGKAQGAHKSMLWLGGGKKNPVARGLYESLGYHVRDCEAQVSIK